MIDLTGIKKLVIGGIELKKLAINGVEVWRGFTNLVPLSTDTDGSIYNGLGYKNNVRLSSSGGISSSSQSGSTTTGFIPFPDGDETVIRFSGVDFQHENGKHYYINFYDANKKFVNYLSVETYSGGTVNHVITIEKDGNGIITIKFSQTYGNGNSFLNDIRNKAKYFRITAKGKGEDMVLTVNEEIT